MYAAIYVAVIVVCILADQLTKIWIFDGLLQSQPGKNVQVLGDFLRFYATYNEGAIFGMFKGRAADIMFFVITVAATPLYFYFLMRARTRSVWGQIGFAFIVGGAIGNAIDRAFICTDGTFFSGQVRDFISFSFFPPVFNVADSFLTVGVVMAVLAIALFDPDSLLATFRAESAAKGDIGEGGTTADNDSNEASHNADGTTDNTRGGGVDSDKTNAVLSKKVLPHAPDVSIALKDESNQNGDKK